jgi:hypothetical protein
MASFNAGQAQPIINQVSGPPDRPMTSNWAAPSTQEDTGMRLVRGPGYESPDDNHPPLISLKNHSAFTANRFWTKGKTFHFVTTQGDHIQVPLELVDHVYPGSGHRQRGEHLGE